MVLDTAEFATYVSDLVVYRDEIEKEARKKLESANALITAKVDRLRDHVDNGGKVDDPVLALRILVGLEKSTFNKGLEYLLGLNDHKGEHFLLIEITGVDSPEHFLVSPLVGRPDAFFYETRILLGIMPNTDLKVDLVNKTIVFPPGAVVAGYESGKADIIRPELPFSVDSVLIQRIGMGDLDYHKDGAWQIVVRDHTTTLIGFTSMPCPSYLLYGDEVVESLCTGSVLTEVWCKKYEALKQALLTIV